MKSLNQSDNVPHEKASASSSAVTFPTTGTTTLTGTNSSANNNMLDIEHSIALTDLNKLATQSTNTDH